MGTGGPIQVWNTQVLLWVPALEVSLGRAGLTLPSKLLGAIPAPGQPRGFLIAGADVAVPVFNERRAASPLTRGSVRPCIPSLRGCCSAG